MKILNCVTLLLFMFNFSFAQQSEIRNLEKTLKEAQKQKKGEDIMITFIKIGDYYFDSQNFKKAIKYYKKSVDTSQDIKNYSGEVIAQNKIGIAFLNEKNYDEALSYFKDALVIVKTHEFNKLENDITVSIALVNDEIAQQKVASEKYDKLKKLNKKNALQQIVNEIVIYKEEKFSFLEKIENLSKENQLIALKLEYKQREIEKKKLEIILLNIDNELKNSEIAKKDAIAQKQKVIILFSISGLIMLIAFVFFIYRGYCQKRKANELLITKNKIIEEKNRTITDSIRYAKKIQEAILTSSELCDKILAHHFVLYKPKDIVSGDFYWAYSLHENHAIWTVADCTGHGVPGAFMNMIGSSLLDEIIIGRGIITANRILDELKISIIKALGQTGITGEVRDGMDAALCVWHKDTNKLEYAGAYNPLYIIRNDKLIIIEADRKPIGFHYSDIDSPFTCQEIQLEIEDSIYLFTDGYIDQFGGEHGKKFLRKRFKDLLLSIHNKSMEEQKQILDETIEKWKGDKEEQVDDICVIGVKIKK